MADFISLLSENKFDDAYALLSSKTGVADHANEYNNSRDIRAGQVGKREDKITKSGTVTVSKLPIPFQRKIVKSAASFLFGSPIEVVYNGDADASEFLRDKWKELRMNSLLLDFCKTVKSETESTMVFFLVKNENDSEYKLKARVLSNKNGKVYPVFDAFGDMISFAWEYKATVNDVETKYLYVWTNDFNYVFYDAGDGLKLNETDGKTENLFGKIPVVYLSQDQPEWWEVQDLIDTYEMSFSKFVDTNGYFASPMYKAKGAIGSIPKKDETGKIVKLDIVETDKGNVISADLEVLSWDRAPEALKLEFETTKGLIYGLTDTPDLSFDSVKGLGNISGIALKLLFFGSILKAKWDEGDYQTAISRMFNLIIAATSQVLQTKLLSKFEEMEIDVRFTSVLPENIKEVIEILTEATGGKAVMSQKTAVAHNPLVGNDEDELASIKEESEAESIGQLGETAI